MTWHFLHTLRIWTTSSTARRAATFGALSSCAFLGHACNRMSTFAVSTTVDGDTGSLRAAVTRANTSRSAVRIEIPAGTYELTLCGGDDDTNASGDLDLLTTKAVTFAALDGEVVIRQSCAGERVLDALGGGLLTLSGVTITGGSLTSTDPEEPAQGGGVRALGNVSLDHATVTANSASGAPGRAAAANGDRMDAGTAQGGGLFVAGSLLAVESVLSQNGAIGGEGHGPSASDGVAAAGGSAEGGAAYVGGAVSIVGGALTENRATGGKGGTAAQFPGGGGSARGGAVAQASDGRRPVSITGARLEGNQARGGNFGGFPRGTGASSAAFPAAGDASGGALASSGALRVENVTATNNAALGGHGGEGCGFNDCTGPTYCPWGTNCIPGAARGGALATSDGASLSASTFDSNRAASGDTHFFCIPRSASCSGAQASEAAGGGLWAGKDVRIRAVQFSQNRAEQGQGEAGVDGLARGGAAASDGNLVMDGGECTGNSSVSGRGGAVSAANVSVANASFTSNTADGRGGAIDAVTLSADAMNAAQNRAGGSGGGAIAVSEDASITRSYILRNSVESRQLWTTRTHAGGGGVSVAGHLTLSASEISGNTGKANYFFGEGCNGCMAIFVGGGVRAGSLDGDAVTFAENGADGPTYLPDVPSSLFAGPSGGGAIASSGAVSLRNATLVANRTSAPLIGPVPSFVAPPQGAAVLAAAVALDHATLTDHLNAPALQTPTLTTHRSVAIAAPPYTVCASGTTIAASSYNWFSDASCGLSGTGDRQESAAFLLGPLADNGGPVRTSLPAPVSVLVDRIPSSACPAASDARGVTRPQGSACDIGSVEVAPL